jgi:hypothetical protein
MSTYPGISPLIRHLDSSAGNGKRGKKVSIKDTENENSGTKEWVLIGL